MRHHNDVYHNKVMQAIDQDQLHILDAYRLCHKTHMLGVGREVLINLCIWKKYFSFFVYYNLI